MKIISIILLFLTGLNGAEATEQKTSVIVDRIENNYAIVEAVQNDNIKMIDLLLEDFNMPIAEGEKIPFTEVCGKFYSNMELTDSHEKTDLYFQFKSNDNSVWWVLTAEEIGSIPSYEKEYNLIYFDNGTTAENKNCDCLPEWECECEVYDDLFLGITEVEK